MTESKKIFKLTPFKATEHAIQKDCVTWLRTNGFLTINTDVMTALGHIPDNARRIRFISHYKQIGYTKGQPDLVAVDKSGRLPPLFIEFKNDDGRLSAEQKQLQATLEQAGYRFLIVRNWREMAATITSFYQPEQ